MGSDWIWELQVPHVAARAALRRVYELARERDLRAQRPDGLINLFRHPDADMRTVSDLESALTAMATGTEHGQFWTDRDVDVFVSWEAGNLTWSLDSAFCYRRPLPEADVFRDLHHRLTDLWAEVAHQLNATQGRVLDEWSTEQVWHREIHDAAHPIGGWPAELGWWTYLGCDHHRPRAPLAEIAVRTRELPTGALLVTLLDDPAAVDPLRYENIHRRWLQAR